MNSPLIQRILSSIITDLITSERLVLLEGGSAEQITFELSESLSASPSFSQFGPWLAGALLDNAMVDDLYATDSELSAMLREVEP